MKLFSILEKNDMFVENNDKIKKLFKENNDKIKKLFKEIISTTLTLKKIYIKNLSFKYIDDLNNNFTKKSGKTIPTKFNSSSSSIIKHPKFEDKYILNIRCVNYSLNNKAESSLDSNQHILLTTNTVIIIDKNFNIIYKNILKPQINNFEYVGIEDIRLFRFKDQMFYIGSSYDTTVKKIKIVSNSFDLNTNYTQNFIQPNFNTEFDWEKNWVFFENNDSMFVIYKWHPIYICKIDYDKKQLNLIKIIKTPEIFYNFRGSTNGVIFDNKIWFIIHSQIVLNNIKTYYHRFVVLNNDLSIYGYSKFFKFENYIVEFCIGLEITNNNNFLITYSTLDKTTKLVIFNNNLIKSLIIKI